MVGHQEEAVYQAFHQCARRVYAADMQQRAFFGRGPERHRLGQHAGIAVGIADVGEPGGARFLCRLGADGKNRDVAPRRAADQGADAVCTGRQYGLHVVQRGFGTVLEVWLQQRRQQRHMPHLRQTSSDGLPILQRSCH